MTIYLGVDVGQRRIGIARSGGLLASPLTTVIRTSEKEAVQAIAQLAQQEGAEVLVVGVPLGPSGEVTDQARTVQSFGAKLESIPGTRVVFWDERLTTQTARSAMHALHPARRKGAPTARQREADRRRLDAAAAAVILQDYLDLHGGPDYRDDRDQSTAGDASDPSPRPLK